MMKVKVLLSPNGGLYLFLRLYWRMHSHAKHGNERAVCPIYYYSPQ